MTSRSDIPTGDRLMTRVWNSPFTPLIASIFFAVITVTLAHGRYVWLDLALSCYWTLVFFNKGTKRWGQKR